MPVSNRVHRGARQVHARQSHSELNHDKKVNAAKSQLELHGYTEHSRKIGGAIRKVENTEHMSVSLTTLPDGKKTYVVIPNLAGKSPDEIGEHFLRCYGHVPLSMVTDENGVAYYSHATEDALRSSQVKCPGQTAMAIMKTSLVLSTLRYSDNNKDAQPNRNVPGKDPGGRASHGTTTPAHDMSSTVAREFTTNGTMGHEDHSLNVLKIAVGFGAAGLLAAGAYKAGMKLHNYISEQKPKTTAHPSPLTGAKNQSGIALLPGSDDNKDVNATVA